MTQDSPSVDIADLIKAPVRTIACVARLIDLSGDTRSELGLKRAFGMLKEIGRRDLTPALCRRTHRSAKCTPPDESRSLSKSNSRAKAYSCFIWLESPMIEGVVCRWRCATACSPTPGNAGFRLRFVGLAVNVAGKTPE